MSRTVTPEERLEIEHLRKSPNSWDHMRAANIEKWGLATYRPMLCGTKTTKRLGLVDFRVVCATCGAGGSVRHPTHEAASSVAVRDSSRACRSCGAS